MAARWGTGEEMIKACKMEYFLPATLEETEILQDSICGLKHNGLDTGGAFEVMQGCLDSSILSIFEGVPTGEVKSGIDEESEATLLTALTEILDNVDDETLSPFDMLPDLEPLQLQKGGEHSPLKFLSLSCSSSEKEFYNSTQLLRKGGNGDNSFSELMQDLGVSTELDLCLPISLEHDGERVSVTLSDLVKHMHPYAMTLCVDGEEQLLPEGGIILEVMDKGEHGEPILAIQALSCPSPLTSTEEEQCVPESSLKNAKSEDSSPEFDSKISTVSDNKMEIVVIEKLETKLPKKCPKNRKRKQGTEKVAPVKKRVLNKTPKITVEESNKELDKQKKKKKVTFASDLSVKKHDLCQIECLPAVTMVHAPMDCKFNTPPTTNVLSNQAAFKLAELKPLAVLEDKPTMRTLLENCSGTGMSSMQELAVSQQSEPKPKSLSLQQYRLLRQQKKPAPKEVTEDNSTKWPTLLEAPKELPAIPCLPDPKPIEPLPARPSTIKNPVTEIMPAWQPRGPGVPPTPEALLVPPASMLASSRKPVSPQTFSVEPVENLAASMSISTVPSSQTLSPSDSVVQNSIPKVNQTVNWVPVKSPPVATTNGDLQNLHVDERVKCFHDTSSASDHVLAASAKGQETAKSQDVPDIAPTNEVTSNKPNAAITPKTVNRQVVEPKTAKPIQAISAAQPTTGSQHVAPIAAQPFSSAPIQAKIMKLAKQMMGASAKVPKAKSPSEELIESFTSEIGIEAADLASLLEQFEETQSKEKVPEVCGGAAAVGNSSLAQSTQTRALKKACSHNLASTADLTPPATPPHQMWKLLTPVTLLEKQKSEIPKSSPTKAVQIEPLPLPTSKMQSKTQAYFTVGQAQPFSLDHDYCHPQKEPTQNEVVHSCKGKQQIRIIIKSAELSNKAPQQNSSDHLSNPASENLGESCSSVHVSQTEHESLTSIGLVTPDASPDRLMDSEIFQGSSERSPSPYLQKRSRSKRKCRARLPNRSGSTSSSSRSRSPLRRRCRSRSTSRSSSSRSFSRSRSRSLSPCQRRNSYSSSRSRFQSCRSRSRSPSSAYKPRRWSSRHSPDRISNYCYDSRVNEETQSCKTKAIEERRVVYIGRVHGGMTRKELRERFSYFGEIEDCTVHFREHGDNYGFVTYYNTKDAFNAIENGSKLRLPNELPFDLCFGGRRQFCRATYADLDSRRDFQPAPMKSRFDALDFDTLLKQAQRNLKR